MKAELLEKKDENLYQGFVDSTVDSCIYHTLEWKRIIERTYGYKPYYVVVKDDERIIGALPLFEVRSFFFGRRLVSIPFSHRVPVLYQDDITILEKLLEFACDLTRAKGCKYLEVKNGSELPLIMGIKESRHFSISTLDLSRALDDIWKAFDIKTVRWGINRAERSGLEIARGSSVSDYQKFYRLELETRKKQGVPAYSFRLFQNIFELLDRTQQARLYLAYLNGVCIAGVVVFYHKNEAIYGYSASLNKREYLRTQPTNLLLWTAIEDAHSEKYEVFDFGITPPSNTGLMKFKSHWGTRNYRIPYYYFLNTVDAFPVIDRTSKKMRIVNAVLRRTPIPVLRLIGPILLRQVG